MLYNIWTFLEIYCSRTTNLSNL